MSLRDKKAAANTINISKLEIAEEEDDKEEEYNKRTPTFKVAIVGDSQVGKTSLITRFADRTFSETLPRTPSMGGENIDKKVRVVDLGGGNKAKLQIWDTAGQEKYSTLTSSFYRCTDGGIVAYSIANKESFDSVKEWLDNLTRYSPDIHAILVGTKLDLKKDRVISTEEGQELANELGIPFFETSSKTELNVDEAFLGLAKEMYKTHQAETPRLRDDEGQRKGTIILAPEEKDEGKNNKKGKSKNNLATTTKKRGFARCII